MERAANHITVSQIGPGPIAARLTSNALGKIEEHFDLESAVHAADYRRQIARLTGKGTETLHRLGPQAVHAALTHALTTARPKPHYLVTPPARQGAFLKRLLPADLFSRLMRRLD